jgi:hypothetical protein
MSDDLTTSAGPGLFLFALAMLLNLANIVHYYWPSSYKPPNFAPPTAFAWAALIFGRHLGLSVYEQYEVVGLIFIGVVGVVSVLPQSN